MSTFGQVVPVLGTGVGFLGEVSRTGGGDPFIISVESNPVNGANINFGDTVVILPDSTGGLCKQFADWQANGNGTSGGFAQNCATTSSSTTVTPTTLAGLSNGMFVLGTGIPAGTYIVSVNYAAGTITISKAATASSGSVSLSFAKFAGIAAREVRTNLGYPTSYAPANASPVGYYPPSVPVSILVRGAITVLITVGTPKSQGPVYMRTILNGSISAGLVGDLEANSDTTNSIMLAGVPDIAAAYFKTGLLDSNNLCEVVIKSRAGV